MNLTRREFIACAGTFALAAGRVNSSTKTEIIVLGAGIAGLSSAYQLAKRGFGVTVIEARDRIGGRIHTLHEPFQDGLYTETGGELFGDGYERFTNYADEFDLPYEELPAEPETGGAISDIQDGLGRSVYLKGKLYLRGDKFDKHPYGLKGDESSMLPATLFGKHMREIGNDVRQKKTTLEELDRISMGNLLRSRGVSKTAVKLINISLNYNSVYTVSAGAVVRDSLTGRSAGTIPLRLTGGNNRLTNALYSAAQKEGAVFLLSKPVIRIEQNSEKAVVHTRDNTGKQSVYTADRIICTVPFSVLKDIKTDAGFSPSKINAIRNLDYTRVTHVYIQAKYAEWDKRAIGSSVWTDTPLERIFSTTGSAGDERGLFTIWAEGSGSAKLEKMKDAQRKAFAIGQFERILPFMEGKAERSETVSWTTDPFAKGAYSHLRVGQLNSLFPHIGTPEGRIHFAGEHTAVEMPGMEGALESAERAVKEVSGR